MNISASFIWPRSLYIVPRLTKAFSELGRLGSLLLSVKGFAFLEKQRVLKRKNKHLPEGAPRNYKYKGSIFGPISGFYESEFEGTTSNLIEISKKKLVDNPYYS